MFQHSLKTLLFVTVFCLLTATTYLKTFAQCEGVYPKTITRKILGEKVVFINDYEDLTGDGKTDLIGFAADSANDLATKIYILPGSGTGDFGTPIQITLPASVQALAYYLKIVDFNSDGKNDFVVQTNQPPKQVIVYQNNGSGAFTALTPTILAIDEEIQALLDINNDGRADLIHSRGSSSNNKHYRLANADGSFGASVPFGSALFDFPADFNADGRTDFPIIEFAQTGGYYLRTYNNMGNGTFTTSSNATLIPFAYPLLSAVADLNSDGKPDLIIKQSTAYATLPLKLLVMTNLGNSNFANSELNVPGEALNPVVKDFNGDGFPDIFTIIFVNGVQKYSIFTNDGTGGFARRDFTARFPGNPIGDLDSDGKTDFIHITTNFNDGLYPKIFNETLVSIRKNICNRVGQTRIVDFDGDGLTDTVFWRESDGRWRVGARTYPSQMTTFNWGQAGDVPVAGDYDGDGRTDYAVFRPSTGTWYYVNSSNGSFSGLAFGAGEDKPVPADYNGDGKTDVAVYRPSTGIWYFLLSGTNQFYGAQFGASEDKPVPADYDGDGKTDIAVFRPSNGFWYVLKSSDGTFFAAAWGINTDTLVPADYDGDGKADIAVMRSGANNIWYIRRSNGAPSASYAFGTTGDIAQPSDWNGDEVWDTGVYRSSSNFWYSSFEPYGFSGFNHASGEVPISSLNKSY